MQHWWTLLCLQNVPQEEAIPRDEYWEMQQAGPYAVSIETSTETFLGSNHAIKENSRWDTWKTKTKPTSSISVLPIAICRFGITLLKSLKNLQGRWRSHWTWRCSRSVEVWYLGTWFSGQCWWVVGLDGLRALFLPLWFYDSAIDILLYPHKGKEEQMFSSRKKMKKKEFYICSCDGRQWDQEDTWGSLKGFCGWGEKRWGGWQGFIRVSYNLVGTKLCEQWVIQALILVVLGRFCSDQTARGIWPAGLGLT